MSKKMKGFSIDPSTYGAFEDPKVRFKHRALMQDYRELQKETVAMRNKLESTKLRKLTLLAEVRFLRRRYKYLVQNKAVEHAEGRQMVKPPNFVTREKNIGKQKTSDRKKGNLQNILKQNGVYYTVSDADQKERIFKRMNLASRTPNPVLDLLPRDRIHGGKEATLRNAAPAFNLNKKERSYSRKEAAFQNPTPILDLKLKERLYTEKETAPKNQFPTFDFNQMGRNIGIENAVRSRVPVFDLNQISGEEEELRDNYEPLNIEESENFFVRGGTDDQHNDLKLSACRNIGNGPERAGKRKISWQDPVALEA